MKLLSKQAAAPKNVNLTKIVVDPKDPRRATVFHDRTPIFTIKTDITGVNPAIVVAATQTQLKTMEKGKSGIVLWNSGIGPGTRNLKAY